MPWDVHQSGTRQRGHAMPWEVRVSVAARPRVEMRHKAPIGISAYDGNKHLRVPWWVVASGRTAKKTDNSKLW